MKKINLCILFIALSISSCDNNKVYKETVVKAFETNLRTEIRTDLKIKFIDFKSEEITVSDSVNILEDQIGNTQKEIEILDEQKSNALFGSEGKKKRLESKLLIDKNKLCEYKEKDGNDIIAVKINCKFSYKESENSAKKETEKELILSPDGKSVYYIKPTKAAKQFYDALDSLLDL